MTQLTGYTIYKTGVTTKGKAWTTYQSPVSPDVLTFTIADVAAQNTNVNAVMYMHGSGGTATQFVDQTAFKTVFETIIDNNRLVFEGYGSTVSQYQGSNHWGRPSAKAGYLALAAAMNSIISFSTVVLFNRSMGGSVGKQIAASTNILTPKIIGMIDCSGVYDYMGYFDNGNEFDLPSWWSTAEPRTTDVVGSSPARTVHKYILDTPTNTYRTVQSSDGTAYTDYTAWVTDSTTIAARSALVTATAAADPKRFASGSYSGLNVYVTYGTADPTAINPISGLEFWNDFHANFGPKSKLTAVPGATHNPPGTYTDPGLSAFLIDVWGLTPPPVVYGNIYEITEAGQMIGSNFYPTTHGTY